MNQTVTDDYDYADDDQTPCCSICGHPLDLLEPDHECAVCGATPESRALVPLLEMDVLPHLQSIGQDRGSCLAVSLDGHATDLLRDCGLDVTEAIFSGKQRSDFRLGFDIRDMLDFDEGQFSFLHAVRTLEFVPHPTPALQECYRVLQPGGMALFCLPSNRLVAGKAPPRFLAAIDRLRPECADLEPGAELAQVCHSIDGLLEVMRSVGFEPLHLVMNEPGTDLATDWFLVIKPRQAPSLAQRAKTQLHLQCVIGLEQARFYSWFLRYNFGLTGKLADPPPRDQFPAEDEPGSADEAEMTPPPRFAAAQAIPAEPELPPPPAFAPPPPVLQPQQAQGRQVAPPRPAVRGKPVSEIPPAELPPLDDLPPPRPRPVDLSERVRTLLLPQRDLMLDLAAEADQAAQARAAEKAAGRVTHRALSPKPKKAEKAAKAAKTKAPAKAAAKSASTPAAGKKTAAALAGRLGGLLALLPLKRGARQALADVAAPAASGFTDLPMAQLPQATGPLAQARLAPALDGSQPLAPRPPAAGPSSAETASQRMRAPVFKTPQQQTAVPPRPAGTAPSADLSLAALVARAEEDDLAENGMDEDFATPSSSAPVAPPPASALMTPAPIVQSPPPTRPVAAAGITAPPAPAQPPTAEQPKVMKTPVAPAATAFVPPAPMPPPARPASPAAAAPAVADDVPPSPPPAPGLSLLLASQTGFAAGTPRPAAPTFPPPPPRPAPATSAPTAEPGLPLPPLELGDFPPVLPAVAPEADKILLHTALPLPELPPLFNAGSKPRAPRPDAIPDFLIPDAPAVPKQPAAGILTPHRPPAPPAPPAPAVPPVPAMVVPPPAEPPPQPEPPRPAPPAAEMPAPVLSEPPAAAPLITTAEPAPPVAAQPQPVMAVPQQQEAIPVTQSFAPAERVADEARPVAPPAPPAPVSPAMPPEPEVSPVQAGTAGTATAADPLPAEDSTASTAPAPRPARSFTLGPGDMAMMRPKFSPPPLPLPEAAPVLTPVSVTAPQPTETKADPARRKRKAAALESILSLLKSGSDTGGDDEDDDTAGPLQPARPATLPQPRSPLTNPSAVINLLGASPREPAEPLAPASAKGADSRVYAIPLPRRHGPRMVRITLSQIGLEAPRPVRFAEHILDRVGDATSSVVLLGSNAIHISDTLGRSWRSIDTSALTPQPLYNCFTTQNGIHLVQCQGWMRRSDDALDPRSLATILRFDSQWNYLSSVQAGRHHWMGSASIGCSGDTIMFCEYPDNSEAYREMRPYMHLRPSKVWRSFDDGESWQCVLTIDQGRIRHMHVCQPDPLVPGRWWVSSGDSDEECCVWRSDDDGSNWREVTTPAPVVLSHGQPMPRARSIQRFYDLQFDQETLLWGGNDTPFDPNPRNAASFTGGDKPNCSLFRAEIQDRALVISEIGQTTLPVRSIIDAGPAWMILTDARAKGISYRPKVFMLFKDSPGEMHHLFDLDNFDGGPTSFTAGLASRKARHGVFFTARGPGDGFPDGLEALRWDVQFDDWGFGGQDGRPPG